MATTTSTTQIPDWFNLSKYSQCKKLSKADWHRQLDYRASIISDLEVLGVCEGSLSVLGEIRASGLPEDNWEDKYYDPSIEIEPWYTAMTKRQLELDERREQYSAHYDLQHPGIRPIPVNIMSIYGGDAARKFDEILLGRQSEEADRMMCAEPYDSFRARHNEDGFETKGFVMVDLELPDTELVDQFKKFIPKYRKFLGIENVKRKPSDTVISKLSSYNILPYLDLYIWELEQNVKIKRSVLAGYLFPDFSKGEIELNQVVKPFAMEVVSDPFLKMLKEA